MDTMQFEIRLIPQPEGRPRPYGIAVSPEICETLMEKFGIPAGAEAFILTMTGTPVIVLNSLARTEVKVAMTPMAWMQLLMEKRREELVGGGEV